MKKIFVFFIERSFVVNLIATFICILGVITYFGMQRDLIPALEFKLISVSTSLIGSSAIDMEKHVTFPIEEAISNVTGIDSINSNTTNSYLSISIRLKNSVDNIGEVVEDIKTRIDGIRSNLPDEIDEINVKRMSVDSVYIMDIAFTGVDEKSDSDRDWLRSVQDSILKITGIVKINSSLKKREIVVEFNEDKVLSYGISISEARRKLLNALAYMPIGSIEKLGKNVSIELRKRIGNISDISNIPLIGNKSGNIVRLKQIAKVEYRFPKLEKLDLRNGKSYVSMWIDKDMQSDAIDLRNKVVTILQDFEKKLPAHIKYEIVGDGARFIEKQLEVLTKNGVAGLVLVCVCLFFMLGARVSLMTVLGIPLSYLGTLIVLNLLGISINLISIVGMILVIGIIVDDAIIVSEKYVQNLARDMAPKDAATDAVMSTFIPVTGTILTTVVAFAPILFIESPVRTVLFAIPCVIISALAFSWLESYFILPNHLQHFVKSKSRRADGRIFLAVRRTYRLILTKCLNLRYFALILLVGVMGFSLYWATTHLKKSFSLRIGEEYLKIIAVMKNSDSFDETKEALGPLHDYLNGLPKEDVAGTHTSIGKAWIARKEKTGPRFSLINIQISPDHKHPKEVKKRLEKTIKKELEKLKTSKFKELYVKSAMKGNEHKKEEDIVTVLVAGGDKIGFETLQLQIQKLLKKVEGVQSVFINEDRMQESWQFLVNSDEIIKYGMDENYVVGQLANLFSKAKLGEVRMRGETTVIYTKGPDTDRMKYYNLSKIKILSPASIPVPLEYLGQWKKLKVLKKIEHENLLRKFEIDVRYDKDKTKKNEVALAIKNALGPLIKKYPAYNFTVSDISEEEKESKAAMIRVAIYCVAGILLILMLCLGSIVKPLLVASAIPFGIIGIIWALYFHGLDLGIMAIIGLIGMAGVVVNDSLIMVDFINKLNKNEKLAIKDSIIEGATSRLRPILLTTITTLGGVFPMAYGLGGDSGFTAPLAFALGWGLAFATVLTLFALPSLLLIKEDLASILGKLFKKVMRVETVS